VARGALMGTATPSLGPAPHVAAREGFLRRYLEPADRLNEMLFGLIMVLTFTLTAGIAVGDGPAAGRELLIATIGCNIAWGLIDGAMYLTACLLQRSRSQRRLRALHAAPDPASALAVVDEAIEEAVGGEFAGTATAAERMQLLTLVRDMALRVPLRQSRLRRDDVYGAVASALLVILTTLPAALPFLVIASPWHALRASNLLLLGALFGVGYQWGRYSYTNRWGAGVIFLIAGLALVGAAIALGG
jgi:hypothetical protein